jgi:hypothetical protein
MATLPQLICCGSTLRSTLELPCIASGSRDSSQHGGRTMSAAGDVMFSKSLTDVKPSAKYKMGSGSADWT